jgi:hypothetical protein
MATLNIARSYDLEGQLWQVPYVVDLLPYTLVFSCASLPASAGKKVRDLVLDQMTDVASP